MEVPGISYSHRLHYRWSQLEEDRWGSNGGSPSHPLPRAVRSLSLDSPGDCSLCSTPFSGSYFEKARFSPCASIYKTADYNTFCKCGCLKLTEIELYFLSSHMTKKSADEWVVVYMGIGNGERFRWLRDDFFPKLSVVAFDPIDDFYTGNRDELETNARAWTGDGTNFAFYTRCFDFEKDAARIRDGHKGKQLLLISDIRGIALNKDGGFDKDQDQDLQRRFIHCLRPVSSLLKFTIPHWEQFYEYLPGKILKQVFCNYRSYEVRLMVDGTPEQDTRYNAWELCGKLEYHHEHVRGQIYVTERCLGRTPCLDCCFDCTVLWDTLSMYAARNHLDPYQILRSILKYHVYAPAMDSHCSWLDHYRNPDGPSMQQRWWDVVGALGRGDLTEAVAVLEAEGEEDTSDTDWADIVDSLSIAQPDLARRIKISLKRPASRVALVELIGSLSQPFTLVRTSLNGLLAYARYQKDQEIDERDPCDLDAFDANGDQT